MNKSLLVGIVVTSFVGIGVYRAVGQADQPTLQDVMRGKLKHAQALLRGLAVEDFKQIAADAEMLGRLSREPVWNAHKTPQYVKFSEDFRAIADSMAQHAKAEKLEACTLDYMQMTMTCVNCHSHVRHAGLAQAGEGFPTDLDSSAAYADPQ